MGNWHEYGGMVVVGLINYHNMVLIQRNIGNGHKNQGIFQWIEASIPSMQRN